METFACWTNFDETNPSRKDINCGKPDVNADLSQFMSNCIDLFWKLQRTENFVCWIPTINFEGINLPRKDINCEKSDLNATFSVFMPNCLDFVPTIATHGKLRLLDKPNDNVDDIWYATSTPKRYQLRKTRPKCNFFRIYAHQHRFFSENCNAWKTYLLDWTAMSHIKFTPKNL